MERCYLDANIDATLNALKTFAYNSAIIRVIEIDGEPWLLAAESLEMLPTEAGFPLFQNLADQAGISVEGNAKSAGILQ